MARPVATSTPSILPTKRPRLKPYPGTITTPILISAIWNIITAVILISSILLAVLAIPIIILCVFEFRFYANPDRNGQRRRQSFDTAKIIGICEIIAGLINLISLPCGIITLIHANQEIRKHRMTR